MLGALEWRPSCDMFDLVTAVETHFWSSNLPADMREIFRVLKPYSKLVIIAEVYKGADTMVARLAENLLDEETWRS